MSVYLYFGVSIPTNQFKAKDGAPLVCPKGHPSRVASSLHCDPCGARLNTAFEYDFTSLDPEIQAAYEENVDDLNDGVIEYNGVPIHLKEHRIIFGIYMSSDFDQTVGFETTPVSLKLMDSIGKNLKILFPAYTPSILITY